MTDHWLQSAFTNDLLVAELLLRAKHSSVSDSSLRPPPPPIVQKTSILLPPRWGHRKNRSKSKDIKKHYHHRGSPTTHLSWSGGSSSDESNRPSDLSSASRSNKVNEGASTSSDNNKFVKRKSFVEQELTSTRGTMNQQTPTYENLKRIKINLDQGHINTTRDMKFASPVMQSVPISCRVEAETEAPRRGFILPDLNMAPDEEDMGMIMS